MRSSFASAPACKGNLALWADCFFNLQFSGTDLFRNVQPANPLTEGLLAADRARSGPASYTKVLRRARRN